MHEEETYAEYLWRERTTIDQISCDTEQTEERKFSDLETEVERTNGLVSLAQTDTQEHPDISASSDSDTLPEYECEHHGVDGGGTDYYGTSNPPQECDWNYPYCPNCGEKL